jgi:hypothetical protein
MNTNYKFITADYRILIPKAWLLRAFANVRTKTVTLTFSGCQVELATKTPSRILDDIDKGSVTTIWQTGAFREQPPTAAIEVDQITLHTEDDDQETAVQ